MCKDRRDRNEDRHYTIEIQFQILGKTFHRLFDINFSCHILKSIFTLQSLGNARTL